MWLRANDGKTYLFGWNFAESNVVNKPWGWKVFKMKSKIIIIKKNYPDRHTSQKTAALVASYIVYTHTHIYIHFFLKKEMPRICIYTYKPCATLSWDLEAAIITFVHYIFLKVASPDTRKSCDIPCTQLPLPLWYFLLRVWLPTYVWHSKLLS